MTWWGYVVIALNVFSILYTVGHVGKPRRSYTPADGVVSLVFGLIVITLYLVVGTGKIT